MEKSDNYDYLLMDPEKNRPWMKFYFDNMEQQNLITNMWYKVTIEKDIAYYQDFKFNSFTHKYQKEIQDEIIRAYEDWQLSKIIEKELSGNVYR